ncbi:MAG: hypothetical protein U1F55_06105 [Chitinivorax sp.]
MKYPLQHQSCTHRLVYECFQHQLRPFKHRAVRHLPLFTGHIFNALPLRGKTCQSGADSQKRAREQAKTTLQQRFQQQWSSAFGADIVQTSLIFSDFSRLNHKYFVIQRF